MRQYVDIHSHILPGLDDGAKTWEEALKMVDIAYHQGIRFMFVTPHYGRWNVDYDQLRGKQTLEEMRRLTAAKYPDMRFYLGNELYYDSQTIKNLQSGAACTLGGTDYILIEFAPEEEYHRIEMAIRDAVTSGYRPIIAHIERYKCLRSKSNLIAELIGKGAYMQINARSLLGTHFDRRAAWCIKMFEKKLIHFIASDCHDTHERKPLMDEAVEKLLKKVDEKIVRDAIQINIAKLIQNKII